MGYPGRNNIYEATIRRMIAEAIARQETAFCREHEGDTQQQLLNYLQKQAQTLGHTPWPREIPGGQWMEERFGSWKALLAQAKLPPPENANRLENFRRYQEERLRQQEQYRRNRAEKQRRARERTAQKQASKGGAD